MPLSNLFRELPDTTDTEIALILNAVTEGICGVDSRGRITFCNAPLLRMTGYAGNELIGRDIAETLLHGCNHPPNLEVSEVDSLEPHVTHESPLVTHELVRRKDGSSFPCDYRIHSVKLSFGQTSHVLTLQDRTELSHEKESSRRAEMKCRSILANSPDIARTLDSYQRMTYCSPRVQSILGFSSEELRSDGGKLWETRIHPADLGHVLEAYSALFLLQTPFDQEYRMESKNGGWVWLHERAGSTYEEDGVVYADAVVTDITERKRSQLELEAKTAFLEAITNATMEGILVVNSEGEVILRNRNLAKCFCLPPGAWESNSDASLLEHAVNTIKDGDTFLAKVNYLYQHPNETSRDEIELKDGTVLDRYSAPVVDRHGKHHGRIWTFRDITERRQYDDRLKQLSAAVEQSPASVVITDPNGAISYVNRKFTECTGYAIQEVIGRNPRIWKSGNMSTEVYQDLWQTITSGSVWRGELCNRKKNGDLFWEFAIVFPVSNSKGEVSHFIAIKEDITQRRLIEEQLRQAQKLEAIGQLAAGIAHEINTPTQFVSDNLTFLQDAWGSAHQLLKTYRTVLAESPDGMQFRSRLEQAENDAGFEFIATETPRAISQAIEGTRRIARIVLAMKEFSHPDSREKGSADLNRAIETTITVARNEWKYVADIETKFDSALPPVPCHIGEINQVILNLIVNAAHAIRDKVAVGEKGMITISTRSQPDAVEIAIADTGSGIPENIRLRVFEPFFTTKEVGKGTGQGLALAHTVVVKKHGGKIWFHTEMGKGTTFYLHLPL